MTCVPVAAAAASIGVQLAKSKAPGRALDQVPAQAVAHGADAEAGELAVVGRGVGVVAGAGDQVEAAAGAAGGGRSIPSRPAGSSGRASAAGRAGCSARTASKSACHCGTTAAAA